MSSDWPNPDKSHVLEAVLLCGGEKGRGFYGR